MALLFDIIPEMGIAGEDRFITPENLQLYLTYEDDLDASVRKISQSLEDVLNEIGCPAGIKKIRNISLTLVMQQEVVTRLLETYTDVFGLYRRMEQLLSSGMFAEKNQKIIRNRVESIVDEQLFQTQRDVFFKIVNAREAAEGEKNIDGPALLFPGIEKTKNQIIQQIERQARELGLVAVNLCKTFQGIADSYIESETQVNDRQRYDPIYHTFGQESRLRKKHISIASSLRLEDSVSIESLIKGFDELKEVYNQKADSLKHVADPLPMETYRRKLNILDQGRNEVDERLKPLRVLKRMADDLPQLVKQLDFFADSHYQARAVYAVLEEIREEMGHVFKRYDLDSFTAVGFLKYKLNGVSHMYESIHYYYAAIQIEKDMIQALEKRNRQDGDKGADAAAYQLELSGIPEMTQAMHQLVALMNQENYKIHQIFLEYKEKHDLKLLKTNLQDKTRKINALYKKMKKLYKEAQHVFAEFLMDDLGSTDIASQFDTCLKAGRDLPEAQAIQKGIKTLLSTRRKTLAAFEKQVAEQYGGELDMDQVSTITLLKIKKDYVNEMLREIQHYPQAQDVFLDLLKEFIKLRDDADKEKMNDQSILWMVEHIAGEAFDEFKQDENNQQNKSTIFGNRSERDLAIAFLSANITPHEVESFSRLLPVLPRNELHLDTSFGRLLLDIIHQYNKSTQSRGGSVTHLVERIYEKRERIRLVGNICGLFQNVAETFFTKIQKEEKKSDHLIQLQRIKYRKEVGEVIKYWQYLVQEQIESGQGQRGRFRRYSEDEKKLMMKYISPDQLELIDRQLASGFDLESDVNLQAVEGFLIEIVRGLFKLFREDDRVKSEFEAFSRKKKFQTHNPDKDEEIDLLANKNFMPNIRLRLQAG